jgi:hypothetical protein
MEVCNLNSVRSTDTKVVVDRWWRILLRIAWPSWPKLSISSRAGSTGSPKVQLRKACRNYAPRRRLPLAKGVVEGTVISILEEAQRPLSIGEIRAQVERQLGQGFSANAIHCCLSATARDRRKPVKRCGRGVYRFEL